MVDEKADGVVTNELDNENTGNWRYQKRKMKIMIALGKCPSLDLAASQASFRS